MPTTAKPKKLHPGRTWRILAQDDKGARLEVSSLFHPIEFDEVVVGKWLHVERMDTNQWWIQVGDAMIDVTVGRDGYATVVMVSRGEYAKAKKVKASGIAGEGTR